MSVVNIVANLVVEIPLLWWLGESAMAVGTLVSFAVQAVVMLLMLDRRVGGLGLREIVVPALKMIAATIVMGAIVWGIRASPIYPQGVGRLIWSMQVGLLLLAGAGVYLSASYLMGLDTLHQLISSRRRT
jgi:peptidoglycan biosynthesis protein MviN/MurJ (putative lipid II flippase)